MMTSQNISQKYRLAANTTVRRQVGQAYSAEWKTLTVSLDFHLSLFHLLHQHGIPDDPSSIPDFSAGFVKPSNDPYNRPLRYISESRQLVEGLR
jgi:hypothetical protein